MLDRFAAAMICLLLVGFAGCGETENNEPDEQQLGGQLVESDVDRAPPEATPEMIDDHVERQTDFAIRFQQAAFEEDENAVFSSYSLADALVMTTTLDRFSEDEKESLREAVGVDDFQEALEVSNSILHQFDDLREQEDPEEVDLRALNDLWVEDEGTTEGFDLDILKRYYGAGVRVTPLGSDTEAGAQEINEYIAYYTNDLIEELLAPGDLVDVYAVVTNVLYLKSAWEGSFDGDHEIDFTGEDGTTSTVEAMEGTSPVTAGSTEEGTRIAKIPLVGFDFTVLMPETGSFGDFRENLDAERYGELTEGDHLTHEDAEVEMPVFEIESNPQAKKVFLDEFEVMNSIFGLGKISDIIHEAVIDVNPDGIEAAAATAVPIFGNSVQEPTGSVSIDRPFLFFIEHRESGVVLFSGQYLGADG